MSFPGRMTTHAVAAGGQPGSPDGAGLYGVYDALPRPLGGVCWYKDSGTYSKWGCWGLKERTGQSILTAHKYRAVTEGFTMGLTAVSPQPPSGSHPHQSP